MALSAGLYNGKIFFSEMCKKHLLFENESCRIIEHLKSAAQNEIKNCQDFEKKIKKVVDKKNSDCYTKQAVPRAKSEQQSRENKPKSWWLTAGAPWKLYSAMNKKQASNSEARALQSA